MVSHSIVSLLSPANPSTKPRQSILFFGRRLIKALVLTISCLHKPGQLIKFIVTMHNRSREISLIHYISFFSTTLKEGLLRASQGFWEQWNMINYFKETKDIYLDSFEGTNRYELSKEGVYMCIKKASQQG